MSKVAKTPSFSLKKANKQAGKVNEATKSRSQYGPYLLEE